MRFALSVLLALGLAGTAPHSQAANGAAPSADSSAGGTITGVVRYRADPARPWKYGRYYVKNPARGELAEAVVNLTFTGPPPATSASPVVRTQTVDQVNFQFVPETIATRVGEVVRFTNSDDALHNVMTADGGEPFNVSLAKDGEYFRTFSRATEWRHPLRLGCVFHGAMRAWVHVFDHPWFAVTGVEGQFRLEHVPPGRHVLAISHAAGRLQRSVPFELAAGATTNLIVELNPDDQPTTK